VISIIFLALEACALYFDFQVFGLVLFVLFPIALGIAIGYMSKRRWAYYGLTMGIVTFLVFLVTSSLEGIICVLMSLPLAIPLILLGVAIRGYLEDQGILKPKDDFVAFITPLIFIFIAGSVEKHYFTNVPKLDKVETERIYPFPPEQVFDAVKSMDTVVARKQLLMYLDLPIPRKCVLDSAEIGGIRTCYFSGGTITEKITEIEKGKVLRMDVISFNLMVSKWLGFQEAIYYFESVDGNSCRMTRITTYTSALSPRFYWRPLEKVGIKEEHEYVFDGVQHKLEHHLEINK